MESIVTENLVSFKELEKKIFQYVCELGREITRIMLENYDRELAEGRDKKQYYQYNHQRIDFYSSNPISHGSLTVKN